jgi:hypothetical protein
MQNAFSRRLRRLAAQRLRNCAELLRTRGWMADTLAA